MKLLTTIAAVLLVCDALGGDAPEITRSLLQKFDVPGDVAQECILGLAELAPGARLGRHFHHGIETGYVLEGEVGLEIDGEAVRLLKAGDSYQIPSGRIHEAANIGSDTARVTAVWVVEKGEPLSVAVD